MIPKYDKVKVSDGVLMEDVRWFCKVNGYIEFKAGDKVADYFDGDDIAKFLHGYILHEDVTYFSKRYQRSVELLSGMWSDGATGAMDIRSLSWWVHDELCNTGKFADGSLCTNWMASTILSDILISERRYFRAVYWWPMTFAFGGGQARINGMI